MTFNSSNQRGERSNVAECIRFNAVKHSLELRINRRLVVSVCVTQILDIFGEVAEEEDVVFANFAGDFDLHVGLASTLLLTLILARK